MKKWYLIPLLAAVLLGAFIATGSAYAQAAAPDCPDGCPNHEDMLELFSEKLGMSAEDLQARLDGGETMAQIAISSGMSFEEFRALIPRGAFGQGANGLFGRAYRRGSDDTAGPYGAGVCRANPDCTPPYLGQQNGGRGAGRRN
jgi:hypothetical protein